MLSYHSLVRSILNEGERHDDRTGVGTLSLFGMQLRHDMRKGFPLVTTKSTPMRLVAEELRWMLLGRSDVGWLHDRDVRVWDSWATVEKCGEFGRREGELGPTYGPMLRSFPCGTPETGCLSVHDMLSQPTAVDQVSQLVDDLRRRPTSRRLVVTLWHPHWSRRVSVPPCLLSMQVKVHTDGSLSLRADLRSSDAFLGLPFDMASLGLLQLLLCRQAGLTPRELVLHFGDVHLYSNHLDLARTLLQREPMPHPTMELHCDGVLGFAEGDGLADQCYTLSGYCPHQAMRAEVAV